MGSEASLESKDVILGEEANSEIKVLVILPEN